MKRQLIALLILVISISGVFSSANAGTLCNNGTMSSNSGRGTCSYNGGVNKSFPSYSDPGSSSYNRQNGLGSTKTYGSGLGSSGLGSTKSYGSGLGSSGLGSTKSYGSGLGSSTLDRNRSCYQLRC